MYPSDTETCYVLLIQPVPLVLPPRIVGGPRKPLVIVVVGTVGSSLRSLRSFRVAEKYNVLGILLGTKLTCRRHISLVQFEQKVASNLSPSGLREMSLNSGSDG